MIETLTLITLSVLLLIYFRPGKTPRLENPLIINRTGRYQATLAPQLNLAQPFIEAIAKQLESESGSSRDSAMQVFEVHDRQVTTRGQQYYLLTINQREGILYFKASSTLSRAQDKFNAIPENADNRIIAAVHTAARQCSITVRQVT